MTSQLRRSAHTLVRSALGDSRYQRLMEEVHYRKQKPRIGRVKFGDLRRVEPICRGYGFDRGRPVDRYYIESYLAGQSAQITGTVLEIGERKYTEEFGQGVTRSDMLHINDVEGATWVADLTDAPIIPSNTYDCIILTQTLHVIWDMKAALRTCYRILKPGGVLLCTVPGITQVADPVWNATWYWSLTELAANKLFGSVFPPGGSDVRQYGNVLAATAFLYGLADRELKATELDAVDPEYPIILAISARKAGLAQRQPTPGADAKEASAAIVRDPEAIEAAVAFLREAGEFDDWSEVDADLQDYVAETEALLLSNVLEHSWGWRRILANAVSSFHRRLVIHVSTPLGDSELRLDNERPLPELQLPREELLGILRPLTVREESVGSGTLFYVER